MPVLTWVGKDKVVNHHHDVPYRVLKELYQFGEELPANQRTSEPANQRTSEPANHFIATAL
jgi:adenine-specific DNA-methyltransferase